MRCLVLLTLLSGCMASSDSPEVNFERANILSDRGRFEDAVPFYTRALEQLPDDSEIFFRRGLCYENLNLAEKALDDYSRCLDLDARHSDAINNRGVVLAKLGRFEDAAQEFTKLIDQQPDNVLALRNRGLCYHDLEQFETALADYDAALKAAPEDADNWFQRGNVYLEQRKFEEAVADYSKAIEVAPNFAKAWMNRGVARYETNDREAAVKDLERAKELDDNIVIPGIDWINAGAVAELAPVTEVTAAKPIIELPDAVWDVCLAVAVSHLEQEGFQDVETLEENRSRRCGRLAAEKEGDSVTVYVGCNTDEQPDGVILPAIGADDFSRALLIIREPGANHSEDGRPAVMTFVENWSVEASDIQPVSVRVNLSE